MRDAMRLAALAAASMGLGAMMRSEDDFYLLPDDEFQTAPQRTVFRQPKLVRYIDDGPLTKRQRRRLRGRTQTQSQTPDPSSKDETS